MIIIEQLKQIEFWNNSVYDYALAVAIFLGLLIVLKIFQVIIVARLKKLARKTKTDFDDVVIEIFDKVRPPFYLLAALYFGISVLVLPGVVSQVVSVIFIVVIIWEAIRAIERIIDFFIRRKEENSGESANGQDQTMMNALRLIIKITVWVLGLILILGNLGVNITSLVAGLGIGGIAVALAVQNILSDIFSSFSIYLDKPFRVGDFIVVGNDKGVVENIGIKSTRLRTLVGNELIISNKELTSVRVQNFRRLEKRRVVVNLGAVYGLVPEKLQAIPFICEKVVKQQEILEFDRCFFIGYGDFSLNFELVYFIKSADYNVHLEAQQKVLLGIYSEFAEQGIDFAYPTQTVHLAQNKG